MFSEVDQQQDYSDGEIDPLTDKRPISKLFRRDTPHHLKNKRVQQHLTDKASSVLSKLSSLPPQVIDEVSPQVENPMPLVQDVGLPIIDDYQPTMNGIDLSTHIPAGEFSTFSRNILRFMKFHAHKYSMNPSTSKSIRGKCRRAGKKCFIKV